VRLESDTKAALVGLPTRLHSTADRNHPIYQFGGINELFNSKKLAQIGSELKVLAAKLGPLLSYQRTT